MLRILMGLVALACGALFLGCGGDDDATSTPTATSVPSTATATPTVAVTTRPATLTPAPTAVPKTNVVVAMSDSQMSADIATGPAGPFSFAITNSGPSDRHIFIVVQTDLALNALPVSSNGEVDLAGAGIVVIAQTTQLAVGTTEPLGTTLEKGNYVLIAKNPSEQGQSQTSLARRVALKVT